MKIKEIIKKLVEANNYVSERLLVCDDLIQLIEEHMPVYWDLIKEKEETYRQLAELMAHLKSENNEKN